MSENHKEILSKPVMRSVIIKGTSSSVMEEVSKDLTTNPVRELL
jgi:hypothetical protein